MVAAEPETRTQKSSDRPFFGIATKLIAFFAAFVLSLVILVSVVYAMYWTSRRAVSSVLGNELTAIAESAANGIGASLGRPGGASEVSTILWRIRQSGRLEYALVVDADGRVLADSWRGSAGRTVSALSATPRHVRHVLGTGEPFKERVSMLGEPYLRSYWPVTGGGRTLAVLCADVHDRLPEGLTALELPLAAGIGVSVASALMLAVAVLVVMRYFDRSKGEMIRVERLATAGALSASLAHEIKNPMGVVLSATELLADSDNITPAQREILGDVREEVVRIDGHLNSFLDITRNMPLKLREEDLRETVSKAVAILRTKARHAGILLESCIADHPIPVTVDKRRIHQALVNLILNAMEACEGDRGSVLVSAELQESPERKAVVTVRDDGSGIPPEVAKTMWEPFYTTKPEGTGLGLPGARQTARRHGGSLTIDSRPGKGAVATLVLPVASGGEA